jgi:hypothetical protein
MDPRRATILHFGDYADDEQARSGQRFYLFESQSMSEWDLLREVGSIAERTAGFLGAFEPTEEPPADNSEAEQRAHLPKEGEQDGN